MNLLDWIKNQKTYIVLIMRGVPGSGKSTLSNFIKTHCRNVRIVSADFFFMKNGVYQFDKDKLGEAHISCFRDFLNFMTNGINIIIVDNVNSIAEYVSPYYLGAGALNYQPLIVNLSTDSTVAFTRQVHNVPKKNHDNMIRDMNKGLPNRFANQVKVVATADGYDVV